MIWPGRSDVLKQRETESAAGARIPSRTHPLRESLPVSVRAAGEPGGNGLATGGTHSPVSFERYCQMSLMAS